jgi:hypothetical protein
MSRENPLWGAPRAHGELLKLAIDIGEISVSKYMVRRRNPLSAARLRTWPRRRLHAPLRRRNLIP